MLISCKLMLGDIEMATIKDNKIIKNKHIKDSYRWLFPETESELLKWIDSRVINKNRSDVPKYLERLGLDEYDPLAIIKVTKCQSLSDNTWFKFNYSDKWEDTIRAKRGYKKPDVNKILTPEGVAEHYLAMNSNEI